MRLYLLDIEKSAYAQSIPVTNNNRDLQYLSVGSEGDVLTVKDGVVQWASNSGGGSCYCVSQAEVDDWNEAFSWGNHSSFGYEVQSNKIGNLHSPNNDTYPTTLAVWNYVESKSFANDGLIIISAEDNMSGGGSFTVNQSGTTVIPLRADPTNLTSYISGGVVYINSSTGSGTSFPLGGSPNDGALSVSTSGIAEGSGIFTANQAGNTNVNIYVPPTNLTSEVVGNTVYIRSSTGEDTSFTLSSSTVNDGVLTITAGVGLSGGTIFTANQAYNSNAVISLEHLGIEDLTAPNDDRIYFWDDSEGTTDWLELDNLTITGNVLSANIGYGVLTLTTSGIATGSETFSANESSNKTFTVNVPPTDIGGNLVGTTLNLTSSTGTGTSISLAGIIPTVGNGTLTLNTSGIATGSGSFTANQSGNSTFTVNVPPTNIGGSLSGTTLNLSSSTGSGTSISLASLVPPTPTLHEVTTAGNTSSNSIVLSGAFALGVPALDIYTTAAVSLPINVVRTVNDLNPLQRWSRGSGGSLEIRSGASGTFAPSLASYNPDAGSNFLIQSYGKDNIGAGSAVFVRAGNSTNSGIITGGTVFRVSNWTTQLLNIDHNGATTLSNLAGSGRRIVTADASGNLSATIAAPISGTYNVTSTSIPANSQIVLGTSTITGATTGDVVQVAQPTNALIYKGVVTAANTVTVYALNPTTSPISTVAGIINIRVIK